MRLHGSWNGNGNVQRIILSVVGGARCSSTAMGVMTINNNWSHDSDSLLEMTPVVSGSQMLMYGLTRHKLSPHRKGVPNDLPTEKEADIRAQIDPMKEDHTVGPSKSALSAWERRARLTVRARFVHFLFCLVTHSSQHAVTTHLIEMRKVLSLPKPRSLNWLLYHYIEQTTSLHICRPHVGAAIVISIPMTLVPACTLGIADSVHRNGATWYISLCYQYNKLSSA